MYLYIELWSAKEAWLKLTTAERQAKLTELLTLAQQHPIEGVVPFSFRSAGPVTLFDGIVERPVIVSNEVARPTGFHYAAAWMVPTREMIKQFEDRVEGLGWWWDYFEQKNAWGVMDREATVNDMISGNPSSLGNPTHSSSASSAPQSSQTSPAQPSNTSASQTSQTNSQPSQSAGNTSTQSSDTQASQPPASPDSETQTIAGAGSSEPSGRLGRTERDIRRLQNDFQELKSDIGSVIDFVKGEQQKARG